VLLAVDGRSGAGKTTLANRLAGELRRDGRDVGLFHLEELYEGWNGLEAGLRAYLRDVLGPLARGEAASWTPWDWTSEAPAERARTTQAHAVVLLEGVGAGIPAARRLLTATLTLRSPAPGRRARALARDGETFRPHWDTWAAQEETLPPAEDGPLDASWDVEDPAEETLPERAVRWARKALDASSGA